MKPTTQDQPDQDSANERMARLARVALQALHGRNPRGRVELGEILGADDLATAAGRPEAGKDASAGLVHPARSRLGHADPLDAQEAQEYTLINPINKISLTNMIREHTTSSISEFLRYLAAHPAAETALPPLNDLSRELNISVAALREQLEVARALGLVDVRPRLGTRRLPFSFAPAVRQSLTYALALESGHFQEFSDLRNHLEAAYWDEAVRRLTQQDKGELRALVDRARAKLAEGVVQVPHEEHRNLHLLIYSRLDNPFVTGLLEAYWELYEAVGLNLYGGDIQYLHDVWNYHGRMVECIWNGDYAAGREALVRHMDLLAQRPIS